MNFSTQEIEAAETLMDFSENPVILTATPKDYEDKSIQVNTYEEYDEFDITDIINNDYKLRILTGIYNFALVELITRSLPLHATKTLSVTKMIFLTLMRIKLDVLFSVLSVLFNVSKTTAQSCFKKTIKPLAFVLQDMIRFPSIAEIRGNMHHCFAKYPETRIVLDCTEIPVEKSKCLNCRTRTYSFYKGRHTIKFLFGASPSGMITFVSKPYGGRASDKAIFNKNKI